MVKYVSLEERRARDARKLHEAVSRYVDLDALRRYTADGIKCSASLKCGDIPPELNGVLDLIQALLTPIERTKVIDSHDIASLLMVQLGDLDHEEFHVVMLDMKNQVQRIEHLYTGTLDTTALRIPEVFRSAILMQSASIICVHNHPSGSTMPSDEDIRVTRQLYAAGEKLGIDLLDHVIIARGKWLSLRGSGHFPV